jgi:hypothetical protein
MFRRVRRVKPIPQFLRERAPHYSPLARDDLHRCRDEIVKASVGASISAAAGPIFACFLSVAAIVSAWDGLHRTAMAWSVCCGFDNDSTLRVAVLFGHGVCRKRPVGRCVLQWTARTPYGAQIRTRAARKETSVCNRHLLPHWRRVWKL